MKLQTGPLALAAALLTGLVYLLCTIALALAPQASVAFFGTMFHWNLAMLMVPVTWGGALVGILCLAFGAALIAAAFGWLYNRFLPAGR